MRMDTPTLLTVPLTSQSRLGAMLVVIVVGGVREPVRFLETVSE